MLGMTIPTTNSLWWIPMNCPRSLAKRGSFPRSPQYFGVKHLWLQPYLFPIPTSDILWMEEILHHLGFVETLEITG